VKFILTNDDGIDAPGLATLEAALRGLGTLLVVAPEVEQSGVGHQVTAHAPFRMTEVGDNRYRIAATPADCARVGLTRIAPDADWLISGVNKGANLGIDTYTSGTVAAAREAAALGYPAMAVSQYIAKNREADWEMTRRLAGRIIRTLLAMELKAGCYWNVNLPHPPSGAPDPEIRFCELDISPHRFRYDQEGEDLILVGDFHARPRLADHDIDCCMGGDISVTCMPLGCATG
jgi:5'-nucleotidase